MNTSLSKNPTFRRRLVDAVMLGVFAFAASGLAMAGEATPSSGPAYYRTELQTKVVPNQTHGDAGNRYDWNVDYPSQLAPQAVPSPHDASVAQMEATTASASTTARQPD